MTVLVVLILAGGATALSLAAIRDNLSYFRTPTEIAALQPEPGQRVRLGGLVAEGSVRNEGGVDMVFTVTDGAESIDVAYSGAVPSLFREGQGVICEGEFTDAGTFRAARVLAKHDEDYTPRELEGVVNSAT